MESFAPPNPLEDDVALAESAARGCQLSALPARRASMKPLGHQRLMPQHLRVLLLLCSLLSALHSCLLPASLPLPELLPGGIDGLRRVGRF